MRDYFYSSLQEVRGFWLAAGTYEQAATLLEIRGRRRACINGAIQIFNGFGGSLITFILQGAVGKRFQHRDIFRCRPSKLFRQSEIALSIFGMSAYQLTVCLEKCDGGKRHVFLAGDRAQMNQ